MNTKAAAQYAHVTAATIRTWCARGAVAATKTAGRWDIEETSLKARVRLAAHLRNARRDRAWAVTRNRVRAALTLPALTGTPKQIAWAEDLRADRIERALDLLFADLAEANPVFALTRPRPGVGREDPLRVLADRTTITVAEMTAVYATEAEYVALVSRVLADDTHRSARFWINHR